MCRAQTQKFIHLKNKSATIKYESEIYRSLQAEARSNFQDFAAGPFVNQTFTFIIIRIVSLKATVSCKEKITVFIPDEVLWPGPLSKKKYFYS